MEREAIVLREQCCTEAEIVEVLKAAGIAAITVTRSRKPMGQVGRSFFLGETETT